VKLTWLLTAHLSDTVLVQMFWWQSGKKKKNAFGEDTVVFEGKYISNYCGNSRAEALALSDDFTIVNRNIDRDECMSEFFTRAYG
jgi:hypothetical protein